MIALVLAATSGCVRLIDEVDPSQIPDMTPTCVVTSLDASAPVVHEARVTAAQEVVIKGGRVESSVPVTDGPEKPRITWRELKVAVVEDVVGWVPPDIKKAFSTGESPGRKEVSAAVSSLGAEDGSFVGYAAVRPVEVEFTGTCDDGDSISGWLYSWTDSDVGVVKCGAAPGVKVSEGGRRAAERHCGRF